MIRSATRALECVLNALNIFRFQFLESVHSNRSEATLLVPEETSRLQPSYYRIDQVETKLKVKKEASEIKS